MKRVRARRKELGLSQRELSRLSRCAPGFVSAVERGRVPPGRLRTVRNGLNRIAQTLEAELAELFPPEYLEMVQRELLPDEKRPLIWEREVSLSRWPRHDEALMVPEAERDIGLKVAVHKQLSRLTSREAEVIRLRFGLGDAGDPARTFAEIARHIGLTRACAEQMVDRALRKLRGPVCSRSLRDYGYE